MSILGKIFSAGAGELVKNVGGVLDNLTTTKEEKLAAEAKIKDLIMGYEAEMQKQVTERWKLDMNSDSWLSKNTRPMSLIFLTIMTVAFIWVDSHGYIDFTVEQEWINLLKTLTTTVYVAYFGSRGAEKFQAIRGKN